MPITEASTRLVIFFDGGCILCSREIEHYATKDRNGVLILEDISQPGFDAAAMGLESLAVRRHLHVRSESGDLAVGVPAFIEIWRRLPGFMPLARLASVRPVFFLLEQFYKLFVLVRPMLPRRRACKDGSCSID